MQHVQREISVTYHMRKGFAKLTQSHLGVGVPDLIPFWLSPLKAKVGFEPNSRHLSVSSCMTHKGGPGIYVKIYIYITHIQEEERAHIMLDYAHEEMGERSFCGNFCFSVNY